MSLSGGPGRELGARNPGQGLHIRFGLQGIRVRGGSRPGSGWSLGLRLLRLGRSSEKRPVRGLDIRSRGDRASLLGELGGLGERSRPYRFVEWYVNTPAGLEQGFTLPGSLPRAKRRGGRQADTANAAEPDDPLVLELALSGDLHPRPGPEGSSLALFDARGNVKARYAKLAALDATGRQLPARMEVSGPGIRIKVDDRG